MVSRYNPAVYGPPKPLLPEATELREDELCEEVVEFAAPAQNYRGERRWQVVYVVRDGEMAQFTRDMGPAEEFLSGPLRVYTGLEDDVATALAIAEDMRNDLYWRKVGAEITAESTLIPDHLAFANEKRHRLQNRSHFGPGYAKQRNGVPNITEFRRRLW